jgi:long-chain acyl-CoA synthetase
MSHPSHPDQASIRHARAEFERAVLGRTLCSVHQLRNEGEPVPGELAQRWTRARAEVISPVLRRRGLGDVVLAISGAAPLAPETLRFFLSCGVTISDVYGSSETSGFMSWSPHHIVPGTSGKPLPGLEMQLAEDGEVMVRAPSVFHGYLHDPERTREVLSEDGWYRTGDIGRWDGHGKLKRECPLIGQACALGDGRPYVSMIAVLDPDLALGWAREHAVPADSLVELAGTEQIAAEVAAAIERVNSTLAPAERIRAHLVIGDLWLPDSDLLTPTAKLKRRGVLARYRAEIERMYPADAWAGRSY